MRLMATFIVLGLAACPSGVACYSFPPVKPCPNKTECAPTEVCVETYGRLYEDAGPARELYCRTPCVAVSDCADYGTGYEHCYGTCYLNETDAGRQGYCGCMPFE